MFVDFTCQDWLTSLHRKLDKLTQCRVVEKCQLDFACRTGLSVRETILMVVSQRCPPFLFSISESQATNHNANAPDHLCSHSRTLPVTVLPTCNFESHVSSAFLYTLWLQDAHLIAQSFMRNRNLLTCGFRSALPPKAKSLK